MEPVPETKAALDALSAHYEDGPGLATSLREAINEVVRSVPGCVGISLSLREADLTFTFIRSNEVTGTVDAVQYLDDGPCVETINSGSEILVEDVLDEDRWQLFAQTSAAEGIRSSLSLPLRRGDEVVGSANFYGSASLTFMGEESNLARAFGAAVEDSINNADLSMRTLQAARQAPEGLEQAAVVDQALGVLVAKLDISVEAAQRRLVDAAHLAGVSQSEVARAIILAITM